MKPMTCEYVRDVYPDVLHGRADTSTADTVRQHLALCADCRAEAALLDQVFAAPAVPPAELEAQVLARVRGVQPAGSSHRRWLLAATVAGALLAGAVLVEQQLRTAPDALVENGDGGLGVIGVDGALVSGTASLSDWSVEELEQLLGEMES